MADKGKEAATTTAGPSGESLIDFASLPATALDGYIASYGLAKGYPPPPSRRASSPEASDDEGDDEHLASGSRRGSRVSARNIEEANLTTTSSRLRRRSPSASVAHLFPSTASGAAGGKRNASQAGLEDGGTEGGNKADEPDAPSHFFDVQEADEYLGQLAGKHFAAQPQPKEGEVVVQFLYRCRAGDKCLKIAS